MWGLDAAPTAHGPLRSHALFIPPYTIGGAPLEYVSTERFLSLRSIAFYPPHPGLNMSRDLRWNVYVDKIRTKSAYSRILGAYPFWPCQVDGLPHPRETNHAERHPCLGTWHQRKPRQIRAAAEARAPLHPRQAPAPVPRPRGKT
jgi:hypothetical protein